ncbi:MAG TPA: hypothetical protein VI819_03220 [Patescibacteria group bacterium]|nr:hypothetical protein [Patescibacteria group bacterium]
MSEIIQPGKYSCLEFPENYIEVEIPITSCMQSTLTDLAMTINFYARQDCKKCRDGCTLSILGKKANEMAIW